MRLSKIKLAGFKSFVDPTTIPLSRQLVGIVGPNGCGKSNTIDAVRWVMGESSAKHLRGESMEDVIFNGSSARKPVGQASVELVFDNSDGTLGGAYAQYAEISVKRLASRDGQSQYFLNGTRCRRRDITDIFLGTGLGPRSYAIIEQGMISRLIEAKPEELRVYIEEAAGISKYKERRRETENRIQHTRENLDRLNDLREEIDKHLAHLKRQAQTAERYKALRQEEKQAQAELLVLRLDALSEDIAKREQGIHEAQVALEEVVARLRAREAELVEGRERLHAGNEAFNEVQGRFYQAGAEISRIEQGIQHAEQLRSQRDQALEQAEAALVEARRVLEADEVKLTRLNESLADRAPEAEAAQQRELASAQALEQAETAIADWQGRWDEFNRRASEPGQRAQVERTRMEHLERQIHGLGERHQRLSREAEGLDTAGIAADIERLEAEARTQREAVERFDGQLAQIIERIEARRGGIREDTQALDELRRKVQGVTGRLASLEALQEAALGKREGGHAQWLRQQGLESASRLGECLRVDAGWEPAVEAVLGSLLGAICLDDLGLGASAAADDGAPREFVDRQGDATASAPAGGLAAHVHADWPVAGLLAGVGTAANLDEALTRRTSLPPGESLITPAGEWVGRGWLRLPDRDEAHSGVLARADEIATLQGERNALENEAKARVVSLDAGQSELRELEAERQQVQQSLNQAHRELAASDGRLNGQRGRLRQLGERAAAIAQELTELDTRSEAERAALAQATAARNEAVSEMERLSSEREALEGERRSCQQVLAEARQAAQADREARHRLSLGLESLRVEAAATEQALARGRGQCEELEQRVAGLHEALQADAEPTATLQAQLGEAVEQRARLERELGEARGAVQAIENALREAEQARTNIEREAEGLREALGARRVELESVRVRRETLAEQLAETGLAEAAVREALDPAVTISAWEARAAELAQRIQRLGSINLAAIDEFKTESERAEYLASQHADLTAALETLEGAIQKIDRETRQRFRDTFDQVNAGLKDMFPRLFGGGEARLEMTGEDLLSTGVAVLARPPGKRLSTINLMSGGEKALTAVALVFAIFALNPAPFCMLDEVDAPLDEANVGRFARLVQEMSERVQFIMITHNKVSMEATEHLIGVTMREAGVSRLVAVDIEEAAQMAAG
ncbi:chromosome segregation protein SMC [Acidihalobacter aeolianus]|uniref:Chromosome partition protein Smc n=1 Tax=Acidihalobacter aeolianus TaxID=2792603 RepID=A0A1D8K741_9GAMM|nr:chromosome segregation protein SMC [Acidihalobacter aeolianus]AOV16740.1 chromosome segregation protein SMC [Acidihalobacter aeolianus]